MFLVGLGGIKCSWWDEMRSMGCDLGGMKCSQWI